MKISVIGCGRWGSFIAWYLEKIGHDVMLYGREMSENFAKIKSERSNGVLTFQEKIIFTSDLVLTIKHADVIVVSVGAQNFRGLLNEVRNFNLKDKTFVLCMKGIEISSSKRLTEVLKEVLGENQKSAIWVGPGHVQDFVKGVPNCMVIDSEFEELKKFLIKEFSSNLIRFYKGRDLIGNEVGAAAKNVIGIAAGMLDGMRYSSLKGALMARGTREVARLISSMGGDEISAYGLCHLGDYEATLFSKYSNNRKFGETFITGENYDKLAEGAFTVEAIMKISEENSVDMPITKAVYNIIKNNHDPKKELSNLFLRSLKEEF